MDSDEIGKELDRLAHKFFELSSIAVGVKHIILSSDVDADNQPWVSATELCDMIERLAQQAGSETEELPYYVKRVEEANALKEAA